MEIQKKWNKIFNKKKIIKNVGEIKFDSHWKLYHHYTNDDDWTIGSYTNIYNIYTIEDFWSFYNNKIQLNNNMFFLMRGDIEPRFEDKENENGGCFSFKFDVVDIYKIWLILSLYLVSDKLSLDKDNIINGITISTKKNMRKKFYIIKIWNKDSKFNDISCINHKMIQYKSRNIIYNKFFN
tara:strand:+ start:241 stop:783 length:543 start_codon:yes stop_codon:yes gene_type:complete